mmetsp:Transcript_81308/g.230356  ORF Transcript_81308/g.230356 Transcript_81308/m.230356 type:complete len:392 (-) Transcript_81308:68-1243(-)|eukprot:CAMPEP_0168400046 /NCGR_PEP_ID=MMETSP0228-20121227/22398_1 /TAXON_ID=133427 /ORGANISM="Protoceratium reticulatum, Strain CCCM 535 (=CCMP 1889)" /LENGTH=391 /DNA_ID=CAMNT_0008413579 /DNA_START=73 /DNA_END=1248 /DNA_ORIENTATION=+
MTAQDNAASAARRRTEALRARRGRLPRITDDGLAALAAHKYQAGPTTPLDALLYAIWWKPLSSWLPLWLAPNVLTLVGAAAAIASGVLLACCSPGLLDPVPRWAELLAGLLVLFYQTCDALDGLQARRTGASSPLGGLLDHGCDCISLTSFTIGYCASQRLGFSLSTFGSLGVSWFPWWLHQWEGYHTGVVRTGGALFGITEIELVVASIHFISAAAGPDVWQVDVMGSGIELRHVCTCIQLSVSSIMSVITVLNVLSPMTAKERLTALRRMLPMGALISVLLLWPGTVPGMYPRLFCVCVGALYSRTASELVLCHMSHEVYPSRHVALALLPVVYTAVVSGIMDGWGGAILMGAFTAFCVFDTARYLVDVIEEVAVHLGVHVLRVGRRDD